MTFRPFISSDDLTFELIKRDLKRERERETFCDNIKFNLFSISVL